MNNFFSRREFLTRGAATTGLAAVGGALIAPAAGAADLAIRKTMANARDFGAKGDGKTDDTAALQKAFKTSPENTAIFLPKGEYVLSGAIDMKMNQSIIGEPLAAKILVKHYNAPAVRVPCGAKVADLFFIYPDNLDPVKVKDAPETISLIGNGAGYIDNITFVGAFVGIGTPKGGANCGQTVIRHVNGFVHDTVVHIDGSLDIVRIENVHSFVAGGPNDEKGYYRTHRKCFHMGATDGLMISKSFMIFGKIFLLKENGNHGAGLSSYLSQCWVEGCSDYGIQVNDGSRISIDGLEITCAYSKALIELNKGAYGRIHSCYMRDSFNSTGVVINEGSGAIITNCEMHGTPGFTGIRVNTKERSIISHNFIHHAEVGIACSKDADGYLISENQISGNNQPLVGADARNALVKDNI